jgi:hypothetical protein
MNATQNPFTAINAQNAELRLTAKELAAESNLGGHVQAVAKGWHDNLNHRLMNYGMAVIEARAARNDVLAAALNRVRN